MAEFYKRLKSAMDIASITQSELCKATGIPKSAMSQYISGAFKPKQERAAAIASVLRVNVSWLMGYDSTDDLRDGAEFLSQKKIYMIPVFDSVSAGFGAYACSDIIERIPLYIENPSDVEDTICINVKGNSMYPKIEDGDRIVVRRQASVDSGQLAVILIDGENAVVKKVNYGKGWLELISINPEYAPRRFEDSDILRCQVLGLVRQVIKNL